MPWRRLSEFVLLLLMVSAAPLPVRAGEAFPSDLADLGLEELMQVEVTLASKMTQTLCETAAAVFVVTGEEIRRSGAATIPEALRMVPGMEVAHINANSWAVTSRGFNGTFANKLLVLIDGRSVYTPLFSGVHWKAQDILLEDVERIEVVRGPGAALWGANAVNGVINIITRRADQTQGALAVAGGGSEERAFAALRYGGKLGDSGHYRLWAKTFDRDGYPALSGAGDGYDDWSGGRGGVRLDWRGARRDDFTLQGELYAGEAGSRDDVPLLTPPFSRTWEEDGEFSGGHLLGRWTRTLSPFSEFALQLYYDRTKDQDGVLGEVRDTADADFQHRLSLGRRQELLWGVGYRFTRDRVDNSFEVAFDPDRSEDHLFSAFLQDEIALVPERLRLTVGAKLERNDYTGFELQPNLRLLWHPFPRAMVWGAVSRAVRTPSRADTGFRVNAEAFPVDGEVALLALSGDRDIDSEKLLAYELGVRSRPLPDLMLDVAFFYNDYDDLIVAEQGTPFFETVPAPPHLLLPLAFANAAEGETYGMEFSANWAPTRRWRLAAAYSFLRMQLHGEDPGSTAKNELIEGSSPRHQFKLRSLVDLPGRMEFDTALYYVDRLPAREVPGYFRLDTRLGWRPMRGLEASLVLQNLLDRRHPEFDDLEGAQPTEVPRGVYGKVSWRF